MAYFRNQLMGRVSNQQVTRSTYDSERKILIRPGLVEEAVHNIGSRGGIDLSELRFQAEDSATAMSSENGKVASVLDVVVFQVPGHCNSQTCDLSEYGVGTLEEYNGMEYLSLCGNDGRLQIQKEIFRGHHMELSVPLQGRMQVDRIIDGAEIIASEKDRTYEVMLANCNKRGREISLSGQVVFQSFGKTSALYAQDDVSGTHLVLMAMGVFFFLLICSFRVHLGTRADYNYSRLLPFFDVSHGIRVEEGVAAGGQVLDQLHPHRQTPEEEEVEDGQANRMAGERLHEVRIQ